MRIIIKESISWIGFTLSSLTLIINFYLFPLVFGETPVNLLGMGSVSGHKNYFINLFSYIVINTVILCFITLFAKEKIKWILGFVFGTCIIAVLFTVFIFSYFEIFWRGKTDYSLKLYDMILSCS